MAKILKNTTGSDIELKETGVTVPTSGQFEFDISDYRLLGSDDSLTEIGPLITSGDIVVNDGVDDITVANGFTLQEATDFIKYPDTAFNIRFAAEPERSNSFTAKNVQEAIEAARISAIGTLLPYPFMTTGNTSNKWLGAYNANNTSDNVPLIIPQNSDIKGITFSNVDNDVDIDIEVYVNNTIQYTWEVRNKRVAWNVGAITIPTLQGDRVSVFIRKVTSGTGDQTAQDPVITLLGKFTKEAPADSGIQTGL